MLRIYVQGDSGRAKPSWLALPGLAAVGLVIVVPLALLALAVLLVAVVLFIPLVLAAAVVRGVGRLLSSPMRLRFRGDGRSNVRVIRRDEV